MKIVFFVRKINGVLGGMEKQVFSIADSLIRNGNEVHILSLDTEKPVPFYVIKHDIKFYAVGAGDANQKTTFKKRIDRQRKTLIALRQIKPDIGIAFMTGSFFYSRIPMWIIRKSLILAERNSPLIYTLTSARNRRYIYFISMLFAKRIIVQFPRYTEGYPKFLHNRLTSIPNRVERRERQERSTRYPRRFTFAGRFSHQKRPLELISAFSKFATEHDDVELKLFGEGELLSEMTSRIADLSFEIQSKIKIMPPSENIDSILSVTDVLCAPSLWEGFPNIVAESLSAGLPVLGFSNCDGLNDLLFHRINGWLANGTNDVVDNLYLTLKESYTDYERLIKNQELITLSVAQYSEKVTTKMWDRVTRTSR